MKNFRNFFNPYLGLIIFTFLFFPILEGKIIWKSQEKNDFSFKGFQSIFFYTVLPNETPLIPLVSQNISKKNQLHIIDLENTQALMGGMEKTHLYFMVFLQKTEDDNTHLLQMYVTTLAKALFNEVVFSSSPWKKEFILQDKQTLSKDLQDALREGFSSFFSQFYETNPEAKESLNLSIPSFIPK